MKNKIIAKSQEGDYLLPMKQGEEQELEKGDNQKNIEVCNFIKNAFCVEGDVEMISSEKPIKSKIYFKCADHRRGTFWVAYGDLKNE